LLGFPGTFRLNATVPPHDPAVDGDVVHFDAAFVEQLFDIAVGEAKAEVPADR